jgi:hypothetical protein
VEVPQHLIELRSINTGPTRRGSICEYSHNSPATLFAEAFTFGQLSL